MAKPGVIAIEGSTTTSTINQVASERKILEAATAGLSHRFFKLLMTSQNKTHTQYLSM
jgi:hypothetical protein